MAWEVAAFGGGDAVPTGRGKRGQDTNGFLSPLDSPYLPLDARGPQGRLVLQEYTLDRSGAFRSGELPLCTGWPRTVMRGKPRKLTSGPYSVPKSARRTEPSPRFPRFAARPKGVAAQRRVWGSQEGAREPYGALAPFCPSPWARRTPPVNTGTSAARRRQCPACPSAANLACGGKPPERRKISRLQIV